MNKEILNILNSLYGKSCRSVSVGKYSKSISFGFGKKILHSNPHLKNKFYSEWEIGTYYGSWRIVENNKIILGSCDSKEEDFINKKIKEIDFGEIIEIINYSTFDVRVKFNKGKIVDFIPTFSDEDEVFHIFCPEGKYIEYNSEGLWKLGKSNVPWKSNEKSK